jgi:tripartite ATP-independent transporter DctM subunit
MDPTIVGIIGLLVLFILMALGLPIGFSFITVGFLGIVWLSGLHAAISALARVPFTWLTQYIFTCVPLFILMGLVVANTGIATDLFEVGYKWVGRVRGGLAMATTIGVGAFSAVSGSSTACAATMAAICYPEMKRKKYSDALSTGCIAAGGGIDLMIPPSLGFVLYGIITDESIGKLLIAGILPGIIQVGSFLLAIYLLVRLKPHHAPIQADERFTWMQKIGSLRKLWSTILLFALVMGGIYLGWFTATEAAAIGAAGAIILTLVQRRLTWGNLKQSLVMTSSITAMISILVVGAMVFSVFLTLSGLPQRLADFLGYFQNPTVIALLIILMYIPLGMMMDATSMIVLTLPIYQPFLVGAGINLIWFGVLVIMAVEIALIMPPIGMNVYTVKGVVKEVPMETIFRGMVPFLIADFVVLILLFLFPWFSLYLPQLMR